MLVVSVASKPSGAELVVLVAVLGEENLALKAKVAELEARLNHESELAYLLEAAGLGLAVRKAFAWTGSPKRCASRSPGLRSRGSARPGSVSRESWCGCTAPRPASTV
jgi:hypothetical protein